MDLWSNFCVCVYLNLWHCKSPYFHHHLNLQNSIQITVMIITQSYFRPQQNALKLSVFMGHYLKHFADMIKKIQSDFILHLNDIYKYIIIRVQEYFVEIPDKF